MICDDDFYAGKCPARKEDGRCVSKFPCSHKVEPPKPPTNADRIRAMTDEELLGFLIQVQDATINRFAKFELPNYNALADWLQQPSGEEDKHENLD